MIRCEHQHDREAFMMYHGALLARSTKRPPPLSDFMSNRKKAVKGIDEAAIIARLKAYQRKNYGNDSKA